MNAGNFVLHAAETWNASYVFDQGVTPSLLKNMSEETKVSIINKRTQFVSQQAPHRSVIERFAGP